MASVWVVVLVDEVMQLPLLVHFLLLLDVVLESFKFLLV